MRINLESQKTKPYLVIKYDSGEFSKIKSILEALELEKKEIKDVFAEPDIKCYAYLENNSELKFLFNTFSKAISPIISNLYLKDSLKQTFQENMNEFNISFFRIEPDSNKITIPLTKYYNNFELEQLKEQINIIYNILLSIKPKSEEFIITLKSLREPEQKKEEQTAEQKAK